MKEWMGTKYSTLFRVSHTKFVSAVRPHGTHRPSFVDIFSTLTEIKDQLTVINKLPHSNQWALLRHPRALSMREWHDPRRHQ